MPIFRWLLAGLTAAVTAFPQQPPQPTFRETVNVVVAPTVVLDRNGNYVNDLKPADFQLLDNGKPQNIKVDVSFIPISLVVAVQANPAAEPVLPKIRKIGSLLQGLLVGEQGEVAIVAFDHRVQVKQDFTSDTDKLEEALKKITPGGSSSRMIDAVVESVRMPRRPAGEPPPHPAADQRNPGPRQRGTRARCTGGRAVRQCSGLLGEHQPPDQHCAGQAAGAPARSHSSHRAPAARRRSPYALRCRADDRKRDQFG